MGSELINKADLQVGMYVDLGLPWFEHPFASSTFLIKDAKTLLRVQGLVKLENLVWFPSKSVGVRKEPALGPEPPKPATAKRRGARFAQNRPIDNSPEGVARASLKRHRTQLNNSERKLSDVHAQLRKLMPELLLGSSAAARGLVDLSSTLVEDLTQDPDAVTQLVNLNTGEAQAFCTHATNVSVLSVMLARSAGLSESQIKTVALGGFVHDFGQAKLPAALSRKRKGWNHQDRRAFRQHVDLGAQLLEGHLPEEAIQVIEQHHERFDGKGYPNKLKGEQISIEARVVAIANRYDGLCNGDPEDGLAPSDAIRQLFREERAGFDPNLLDLFIRNLGLYPPGTAVGLSDDNVAMVVRSNPKTPLQPQVVIYSPMVPRHEAVPVDLSQTDLRVVKGYRLRDLPSAIGAYLALTAKLNYYLSHAVDQGVSQSLALLKAERANSVPDENWVDPPATEPRSAP